MRNPIDMYGTIIEEGHYVNYPVRKKSDIYVRTAKVLRVRQTRNHRDQPQMVLDVVVAIPPRVWERKGNWESKVRTRKVTVSRPHRTTILPETYIQKDRRYRTLLDF